MIRQLTLIDFLAHSRSVFDLSPGLNVLTGPNNIGKSAVVEALRCLASNPAPRHVIRHGAAEARVEAVFEDGARLCWVRRPKYALYELTRPGESQPEIFAKFGRQPPEAVLALLRLCPAVLDGGLEIDVHLGNQRQPVFLLDEPGTARAAFFAASSEAAHLLSMQHLLKERLRRAKADERRADARRAEQEAVLDRLAALPDLEMALALADGRERDLALRERAAGDLSDLLGRLGDLSARRDRAAEGLLAVPDPLPPPSTSPTGPLDAHLTARAAAGRSLALAEGRLSVLGPLTPPPPTVDTAGLARRLADIARTRRLMDQAEKRAALTARLRTPPRLADPTGPARLLEGIAKALDRIALARKKAAALADLSPPPDTADPARLADLSAIIARRAALAERRDLLTRRLGVLTDLAEPPSTANLEPMRLLVDRLRAAGERATLAGAALVRAEAALEAGRERIAARLAALGACPLCGAALTVEGLLDGGHAHAGGTS